MIIECDIDPGLPFISKENIKAQARQPMHQARSTTIAILTNRISRRKLDSQSIRQVKPQNEKFEVAPVAEQIKSELGKGKDGKSEKHFEIGESYVLTIKDIREKNSLSQDLSSLSIVDQK